MLDVFRHAEADLAAPAWSVFMGLRQFTYSWGRERALSRIEVIEFGQHRRVSDQQSVKPAWSQTCRDRSS